MTENRTPAHWRSLLVVALYFVAVFSWVLLSDWAFSYLDLDPSKLNKLKLLINFLLLAFSGLMMWGFHQRYLSAQQGQSAREEGLQVFLDTLPTGALLMDPQGRIQECNQMASRILGKPLGFIRGKTWSELDLRLVKHDATSFQPDHLPHDQAIQTRLPVRQDTVGIWHYESANWIWMSMEAHPHLDIRGQVHHIIVSLSPHSSAPHHRSGLMQVAGQDPLTGMASRAVLMDALAHALVRTKEQPTLCGILCLGLDRFRNVNDSLGREAGDRVLQDVAQRLEGSLLSEEITCRIGGDEFAVLFPEVASVLEIQSLAEHISQAMRVPFSIESEEIYLTCSIGIALGKADTHKASDLLRDAEIAMGRAKAQGKNCIEIFNPAMSTATFNRVGLESELRHALERREFEVYYQPLVKLSTGRLSGWEALIRWNHPRRGFIHPAEFIPVAEESGLIVPVGLWCLEQALLDLSDMQAVDEKFKTVEMSINLSVRQFEEKNLVNIVANAIEKANVNPRYVKLEVTESAMMRDAKSSIQVLQRLKELGVQLVIDDFGTGFSSMSYLKRMPLDALKIDKSFVEGLGVDPEDTAIVHAIITLAKALDLHVIAEGVETAAQLSFLTDFNCETGQGYFFGQPQSREKAMYLMAGSPIWA